MSVSDNVIQISHLKFNRGERCIFKNINLSIPKGKITAIMGPSGTGKTTLLKMIGGQLTPDSGKVIVQGTDVHSLARAELFSLRKNMGMLFQSGALFSDMSVFENVAFPLQVNTDLSVELIRDVVLLKLQAVGLRGATSLMPSELSGGMARRVALARAIALDPQIVMYDEPFAGQDPIGMGVLVTLIKKLNQSLGHTSVIVSHDIQETLSIADYICILADGEVIAQGSASEIRESSSQKVQQFIHGYPDGPVPFHYPSVALMDELTG
ncbi:MAG: toluene tolerance ABC efflux transporter, ATP-binding protein [Osedax symbiont Rs2]|nr:MAG: toluene tolerance ABC efflux transporter, ATP-binding protein [Osedax symbiont Rs2]